MRLSDPVTAIKGVGDKKASYFKKLGIDTVGSLLYHFPRTYRDYPEVLTALDGTFSEPVCILATIIKRAITKPTRRVKVTTAYVSCGGSQVTLVWFNMPYIAGSLREGEFVFYGNLINDGQNAYKMEQPVVFTKSKYESIKDSLQPVYPLTKDLKNSAVSTAVSQAFADIDEGEIKEFLDEKYLEDNNLPTVREALYAMHFPTDRDVLKRARRRIVFNEFFLFFLRIGDVKTTEENVPNTFVFEQDKIFKASIEKLPFTLTGGQLDTLMQIREDLTGPVITQRLIQADVGSGKTILSFLAMVFCAENGYKSAIMAPTEVLASQHYQTFKKFSEILELPYDSVLLTGKMSAAEKRKAKERLKEDGPLFVVGTHALIQEGVVIKDLAFTVVDEQHRFGVKQRKSLSDKGVSTFSIVMSATPIPRSLAMIMYGDMNISIIKDVPKSRIPIKNCIIREDMRKKAYQFLVSQINKGYQAYIICPLVDKSEKTEAQNVLDYSESLKALLPEQIKIGTMHGRLTPDEKNAIMQDFADRKTDILVSTTVIEVGIDVPNATVIMIENAKRFGLSQLHQLRGRVGRGGTQSYCIFMDDSKEGEEEDERLSVINSSNDGFFIANEDMRLRGPGELYGLRQSGSLGFYLADIYSDADVMMLAKAKCDEMGESLRLIQDDLFAALPSWNSWYNI